MTNSLHHFESRLGNSAASTVTFFYYCFGVFVLEFFRINV
jgi:hypothetical protein